jgi:hypothetical protein
MKKKHLSSLVAFALAAFCGSAHAEFGIEDPATKTAPLFAARGGAGVTQIGSPAMAQPVVRGMAKEVSLLTALKQIVPQGWRAKRVGAVSVDQMVAWRGDGRSWVAVLQDVAVAGNFNATVDWERREVSVGPAASKSAQAWSAHGGAVSVVAVAPQSAPAIKTWTLVPSLTLRENVEAWGKLAGWDVSWVAADYGVTTAVSLTGAIDDEVSGPIPQLAAAYETADQPLEFKFYAGNRVVRVQNATYKQLKIQDPIPNRRAMQ